jgi:uncharacterized membrane protein
MTQLNNEDGSAGSLIGSIVCFMIVGVAFMVVGKVVDKIIGVTNQLMLAMAISQDAANTIYYLSVIFAALPFLYFLALWINYLSTSSDESSGGV